MLPICFADSLSLIYDKNGNLVTGDGFYRVYNSLNQLWKVYNGSDANGVLLQEYTYHPVEERVLMKKTYNLSGDWVETVIYVNRNFVRVINSTETHNFIYVYHEGSLIAERREDLNKTFYHPDNVGSTTLITDNNGNLLENTFYSPYGLELSGGSESDYSYEGKEQDEIMGSLDFHFRGYKSDWGKFTQPDTLLPNVYDPQQLNRYSFERSNPYKYTDEDGHLIGAILFGVFLLAVATASLIKIIDNQQKNADVTTNLAHVASETAPIAIEQVAGSSAGPIGIGLGSITISEGLLISVDDLFMKEEDKEEDIMVKIKRRDTLNPNAEVWYEDAVKLSEMGNYHSSRLSDGWGVVLDEEGNVDYYCIGSGCPDTSPEPESIPEPDETSN